MSSYESNGDNYKYIAISEIGINHRISNLENQDAILIYHQGDDFVLAVSDGVGSCSQSAIGAQVAVDVAKKAFLELECGNLEYKDAFILNYIIREWKNSIDKDYIDDFCATLKIAIKMKKDVLLISLGDGMLAFSSCGETVFAPVDELLFANQTECLNSNVRLENFWVKRILYENDKSFLVIACTDGVVNGIQEGKEKEFISEIKENIHCEALKDELENFLLEISDYSFDDKTIGVIKYEKNHSKSHR